MRNGANRADVLTTSTEYYAFVWVYDSSFLAVIFFKFESANMAEVNAFSASYALIIIYLWVPRYFFTRNALIRNFRDAFSPLVRAYYRM